MISSTRRAHGVMEDAMINVLLFITPKEHGIRIYSLRMPLFVNSLLSNDDYTEKVSHFFDGQFFERSPGVVKGVLKDKDKVNKVSKIL